MLYPGSVVPPLAMFYLFFLMLKARLLSHMPVVCSTLCKTLIHLQNTVAALHVQEKMGKERSLIKTLREFSEVTSVDANLFNSGCHHDHSQTTLRLQRSMASATSSLAPIPPSGAFSGPSSLLHGETFSEDNPESGVERSYVADANRMQHIMISSRDGQ